MAQENCSVFRAKKIPTAHEDSPSEIGQLDLALERRKGLHQKHWGALELILDQAIEAAHSQVLLDIEAFVYSAPERLRGKVPSALIVTGPSASSHLFFQFRFLEQRDVVHTSIAPTESPNLKSLVRNLISKTIQLRDDEADDHDDSVAPNGPRLLNYDLDILRAWCAKHGIRQIVLDLQNSEAFDLTVLTEFIVLLQSWVDRLPIVILFGIATSIEEFQERLPTAAIRCLQGESFDIARTEEIREQIFEKAVSSGLCHLGPSFAASLLQRAEDNAQNTESFKQAIKYAYMCHFYGNPTSIFLDEGLRIEEVPLEVFDAVRNHPSFYNLAERLLENEEGGRAREILQSNRALFDTITTQITETRGTVTWTIGALRVFHTLYMSIDSKHSTPFSSLYVKCLAGNLSPSAYTDLLTTIKKIPSDKLIGILALIYDTLMTMPASNNQISPDDFNDLQNDLTELLTSQHSQSAYSDILTRFHALLETYFQTCLVSPKTHFPYEILFYDTKALHHNALSPRPRFALERALSTPQDYLGGDTSTQPYVAILYQLYVESGALINVHDLWSAFNETVGSHHEHDGQLVMGLFFRSLATLRYLGMVKSSRRRVDHIGKTLWKGL